MFRIMLVHLRVQNVGQKTRVLEKIPGSSVNTVERCSGHATWESKEFHETALKIGRPVFRQMTNIRILKRVPDVIASDCQLAAHL